MTLIIDKDDAHPFFVQKRNASGRAQLSDVTNTVRRMKLHQSAANRRGQEVSLFSHNPILDDSELQFWHGDKAGQSRARVYLLVERNLSNERIAQRILSSRVTVHRGAVRAQWSVQVKNIVTDARASMFKYVENGVAQVYNTWPELEDLTQKQRAEVWGVLYDSHLLYCSEGFLDNLNGTVDLREVRRGRPLSKIISRNLRNGL